MKTALMMIVSAGCLIFTGWAIGQIQHRNASTALPVEQVVHEWGVLVMNTTKKKGAKS